MLFYVKQGVKTVLKQGLKVWYRTVGWFRRRGMAVTENGKALASFQGRHMGERCFLVGNGPSLRRKDLEILREHGEVSFACNVICRWYDQVKWRPTYHFISDVVYTAGMSEEISYSEGTVLFMNRDAYREMKKRPQSLVYVNCVNQKKYRIIGDMLSYYIPAQATVMTFMIEMAMYMGFREIYLLGVDCTNSFTKGHFTEDYVPSKLDEYNLNRARQTMNRPSMTLEELGEYRRERSIMAYRKLKSYASAHGIRICNVSRGGELDVFERADFDMVIGDERIIYGDDAI